MDKGKKILEPGHWPSPGFLLKKQTCSTSTHLRVLIKVVGKVVGVIVPDKKRYHDVKRAGEYTDLLESEELQKIP